MILSKIVLIGDGAVGKTALRERYLGKGFRSNYLMTIGADFSRIDVKIDDSNDAVVVMQIWDLAGQPRFDLVRAGYYAGCHGAICVFDVTRLESFDNTLLWCQELRARVLTPDPLPLVLIGNKTDLRDANNPIHITTEKATAILDEIADILKTERMFVTYCETSAKTGENVQLAFDTLAKQLYFLHGNKKKA